MSEGQPHGNMEDGGEPWVFGEDAELQEMVLNSGDVSTFLQELAALASYMLSTTAGTMHDGPCLTPLRRHETLLVRDIGRERRWPEYLGEAAEQGIGLILAIPMELNGAGEAVVGQPGVIMAQNRCSQEEAIHELSRSSSGWNTKLRETAAAVVGAMNGRGLARENARPALEE